MSLLMDALKKAEQTKQQSQDLDSGGEPSGGLSLEPLPVAELPEKIEPKVSPAHSQLPDLSNRLEALDEEFMAHMASSASSATPARSNAEIPPPKPAPTPEKVAPPTPRNVAAAAPSEQEAARNLFASKQAPPSKNKTFAIVVGAATLVAVAGIGVYFWLQLAPSRGLAPIATPPAARPPSPPPVAAVVAPPTAAPPPTPAATAPTVEPPAAPSAAEKPVAQPAPATAKPVTEPLPTRVTTPARPATAAPEDAPIRITRSKQKMNPALTQAFEALNAGDIDAAQTGYGQVLKSEPRNLDALHGLAAAAIRQGQLARAEDYYLQAIEADPRDAIAQAGMIGLRGQGDPVAAESRLKTLLAAQPDQAFLHFALGNVQAATQRWSEAQQSFFKAFSADPDNPDYLFNLAVSLDHLRQPKLAAQYYNQALVAQTKRPANFDKVQAAVRLRELQP